MPDLHDSELIHFISHQLKLIRGEIWSCHSPHTPSGIKSSEDGKVRWTPHICILYYKLGVFFIYLAVEWHMHVCVWLPYAWMVHY